MGTMAAGEDYEIPREVFLQEVSSNVRMDVVAHTLPVFEVAEQRDRTVEVQESSVNDINVPRAKSHLAGTSNSLQRLTEVFAGLQRVVRLQSAPICVLGRPQLQRANFVASLLSRGWCVARLNITTISFTP